MLAADRDIETEVSALLAALSAAEAPVILVSNEVGMGIVPCEFIKGSNADSLGLTGQERFSIDLNGGDLQVNQLLRVRTDSGKQFDVRCRLDTEPEVAYFRNGGILHYVLRKLSSA